VAQPAPAGLAHEALRPQAGPAPGTAIQPGLGWLIRSSGDVAVHSGASPLAATVLLAHGQQVVAVMANRLTALEPLADLVLNATH
jgi:hypothetical protein